MTTNSASQTLEIDGAKITQRCQQFNFPIDGQAIKAYKELIETEISYLKDLQEILLKKEAILKLDRKNKESLNVLFDNINLLIANNKTFLNSLLEESPQMWPEKLLSMQENYKNYLKNVTAIQINTDIEAFFKNNSSAKLPLNAYLIKPTQRAARYHMLMQELQKEANKLTQVSEANKVAFENSVNAAKDFAAQINLTKGQQEIAQLEKQLQNSLKNQLDFSKGIEDIIGSGLTKFQVESIFSKINFDNANAKFISFLLEKEKDIKKIQEESEKNQNRQQAIIVHNQEFIEKKKAEGKEEKFYKDEKREMEQAIRDKAKHSEKIERIMAIRQKLMLNLATSLSDKFKGKITLEAAIAHDIMNEIKILVGTKKEASFSIAALNSYKGFLEKRPNKNEQEDFKKVLIKLVTPYGAEGMAQKLKEIEGANSQELSRKKPFLVQQGVPELNSTFKIHSRNESFFTEINKFIQQTEVGYSVSFKEVNNDIEVTVSGQDKNARKNIGRNIKDTLWVMGSENVNIEEFKKHYALNKLFSSSLQKEYRHEKTIGILGKWIFRKVLSVINKDHLDKIQALDRKRVNLRKSSKDPKEKAKDMFEALQNTINGLEEGSTLRRLCEQKVDELLKSGLDISPTQTQKTKSVF